MFEYTNILKNHLKSITTNLEPYISSILFSGMLQEMNKIDNDVIKVSNTQPDNINQHYMLMKMNSMGNGDKSDKLINDEIRLNKTFFLKTINTSAFIGEIISFDKLLDNVINDTLNKTNIDDFRMPYKSLFINKVFKIGKYNVFGVAVNELDEKTVFASAFIMDEKYEDFDTVMGNLLYEKKIDDNFYHNYSEVNEKINVEKENIIMELRNYILNCIHLLNNPEPDIVKVSGIASKKKRRVKGGKTRDVSKLERSVTTVKVTGELRRYVSKYNSIRNKRDFQKSFIVRGHWRHLSNKRFKEEKSIWIKPYIKGSEGELIHKFINVK
jgi:hypothetical protein